MAKSRSPRLDSAQMTIDYADDGDARSGTRSKSGDNNGNCGDGDSDNVSDSEQ